MKLQVLTATLTAAALFGLGARVAVAAEHPAYLHALTDLKKAEMAIASRHGDQAMSKHEHLAMQHVQAAESIIYQVAPEERKPVDAVVAADTDPGIRSGKLHDALAFLQKAHDDMHETESDTALLGERKRALQEVDAAMNEVNVAIENYNEHK